MCISSFQFILRCLDSTTLSVVGGGEWLYF